MSRDKISKNIFKIKWRLLGLLSFKYFLQHGRSFENWGKSLDIPQSYIDYKKKIITYLLHPTVSIS